MEDALFDLSYVGLNIGSTISVGSDIMFTEQVTTTEANKITVTNTPQQFLQLGTIGWYTIAGKDSWNKITFTEKVASVADLPIGTTVCVKYIKTDDATEELTVSAGFIPNQCYALLTLPLFKSGTDTSNYSSSSKVGEVQVEIPSFLLSGSEEFSLSSSGTATSALSGNALATYDGSEGCDGDGYYAKLKKIVFNKDEFADVKSIVIADSNIELASGETQTIEVYAMYGGAVAPKLLNNSKLTFTASGSSATVDTSGKVTASASGTSTIEVVVTSKNTLSAKAVVVVG